MKKESVKEYLANGHKCLLKHMMKVVVMIFIIGIILIFKDWFNSIFTVYLIDPIFSKIPDHSSLVGLWVFVLSVGLCSWLHCSAKDEIGIPKKRYIVEGSILIFYLAYRLYYGADSHVDRIIFHSVFQNFRYSYIDELWSCVVGFEVIVAIHRNRNNTNKSNLDSTTLYPFLTDIPTFQDDFRRKEYAKVLIDKIFATCAKDKKDAEDSSENGEKTGAFVINISENYGYGKSSFFLLLREETKEFEKLNSLILFDFKPWLCDSPQKIVGEFFKLLGENLSKFIPDINKMINKYVGLLLEYYSSKNVFSYLINSYRKEQSSILVERRELMDKVRQLNRPVVILIDDVDRLHDDELMVLLSLLRNTADFPNVYYIMAADVEYVKQVLRFKNIEDPDSYLKKFINVEFLLPGYDEDIMERLLMEMLQNVLRFYLNKDESRQKVEKSIESIFSRKKKWSQVFTNIRDMKRFLNVYSLAIDFYINNNKARHDFNLCDDIDLANLFAIELVKYLSEPIYRVLRDRDDLILNLSESFDARYNLKKGYEEIVSKILSDPDLEDFIRNIQATKKDDLSTKENSQTKEEKETSKDFDLSALLSKNKTKSDKEKIYFLLNFLFCKDSFKLEVNSLCHKDAYFRYYSYRFKNNQISVNEVSLIIESDMDTYKKEIKTVFNEKKQQSFIHKLRYINNTGSSDTDVIEKLFIFVDEAYKDQTLNSVDITKADIEQSIFKNYSVINILSNWFENINNSKDFILDNLRNNMCIFIAKDKHLNLLFLFLKEIEEPISEDRFIFTYSDLHNWCSQLLYRFFKEDPSIENSKEVLKKMLIKSMRVEPKNLKWLIPIVQENENHFTWNNEYLKYLFQTKSKLKKHLFGLNSPETKDLEGLLELDDIGSCTVEEHPFLEMCKKNESNN